MQAAAMQIIYKGVFQWFLKLIVGVQFTDCRFLKKEKQFIILANHNSHLDTLSLLASLPGDLLWKVKPVAAEDYFGKTRFQASISNFFINTLLIRRKGEKDSEHDPIRKMLEAIDAGYSLILFPEGTRGKPEQMGKIKSGIARILSLRPEVKYIPVFMTGMGRSLPKGKMILLPYKASIYYGMPALVKSTDTHEILEQITGDFERMREKRGEYLYVSDENGISILEVAPNSVAFEAGIRRGDKILAINGEPVTSEVDILKAVKESTAMLPIKIKSQYGKINDYILQPGNRRLGVLLVPRMVKSESRIDISSDEFKRILEELKSKK